MFGIAAELRHDRAGLLLRGGQRAARIVQRVRRAIDRGLRGDARGEKLALTRQLALLEGEGLAGRCGLRAALAVVRLERFDLQRAAASCACASRTAMRNGASSSRNSTSPRCTDWLSRTASSITRPATLVLIATRAACT